YYKKTYLLLIDYIFFFQAEDGIRDFHVTGVQTCALPISQYEEKSGCKGRFTYHKLAADQTLLYELESSEISVCDDVQLVLIDERSEERRVGKECISASSADVCMKNE